MQCRKGLSLDNLVGEGEQGGGHGKAEQLSGLEIDHELELRRLLDWDIRRLFAFQDFVDKVRCAPIQTPTIRPIRQQSTGLDKFPVVVDRGEMQLGCEFGNLPAKTEQERSFQHY